MSAADCCVDFCEGRDEKILTVRTDGPVIKLGLCNSHADALRDRLATQLGVPSRHVNLSNFGGTTGELQNAIDYLDYLAANEHATLN